MTRRKPDVRAVKPNERERLQRQALIDALLDRALRGALTIPEAAVLAEAWRAERRVEEKTRRQLTDTTRALQRHREAADAEIRRLEGLLPDTAAAGPSEALCGSRSLPVRPVGIQEAQEGPCAPVSRTNSPSASTAKPQPQERQRGAQPADPKESTHDRP